MNDRIERINKFLNDLLIMSKTGPLTEDDVYSYLINQGINSHNNYIDIHSLFEYFTNYFKGSKKIDVSMTGSNYFCYFSNHDENISMGLPCIKIYVPLDIFHLKEGARQLFTFLEQNNISHQSKIARKIRFDNIVLRIEKKEDALLVQEFINNNKYIQEGLIKPSPFAITNNNIAYASDGCLSYNETVAFLIFDYINHIKNGSLSNGASFLGFKLYINEVYKKYFITGVNFDEFVEMNDGYYKKEHNDFNSLIHYIANYMEVLELIMLSLEQPKKTINDYYNYFENLCSKEKQEERIDYIYRLKEKNKAKDDDSVESIDDLIKELVSKMIEKYGYEAALKRFKNICKHKNIKSITRDNKLRYRFENRLYELEKYIKNKYADKPEILFTMVNNLKAVKRKEEQAKALEFASIKTYIKYVLSGKVSNQLIYALRQCSLGDYMSITNDDYARQNLIIKVKPHEIEETIRFSLKKNGYIIDDKTDIYVLYNDYIAGIAGKNQKTSKK